MATRTVSITSVMVESKVEEIVRFTIHQRIQHILMIVSFTMLAFTGLPQKFNTWGVSEWWVNFLGGIEMVRNLHRFFAVVLLADAVYHIVYIFGGMAIRKQPLPLSMIPSLKDFQGMYQEIRYFVGLSREEPQYDRFNWREKFDYWAVFWGTPILGISGLILMYPVQVTHFLPGQAVPMAMIAHSDEAFLAVAWIFGSHLFFTHLSPGVFPLNKSIFTGRIPVTRLQEEHPLEWKRIQAALAVAQPEAVSVAVEAVPENIIVPENIAVEAELPGNPDALPKAPNNPPNENA